MLYIFRVGVLLHILLANERPAPVTYEISGRPNLVFNRMIYAKTKSIKTCTQTIKLTDYFILSYVD